MTPRLGIRLSSGLWLRRWLICLSSSHGAILAGYKPYCKARHIYISWLGIFVSRFERDVKNASNTNVAKLVSDIRRSRVDGFISFLTADDKRYGFRFYRVIHLLWDLGWVGLTLIRVFQHLVQLHGCICQILSAQTELSRKWNNKNQSQVTEQINHPVYYTSSNLMIFSGSSSRKLDASTGTKLSTWRESTFRCLNSCFWLRKWKRVVFTYTQWWCFLFFWKFLLPIRLHNSCSISPTAGGTYQKWCHKTSWLSGYPRV